MKCRLAEGRNGTGPLDIRVVARFQQCGSTRAQRPPVSSCGSYSIRRGHSPGTRAGGVVEDPDPLLMTATSTAQRYLDVLSHPSHPPNNRAMICKEPDMLGGGRAGRRGIPGSVGRTTAVVGTAAVAAHGIRRRGDRREDRRDDRADRRDRRF